MRVPQVISNFNKPSNEGEALDVFLQHKSKQLLKAIEEDLGVERSVLDAVLKAFVGIPLDLDGFVQTMQHDLYLQLVYNKSAGNVCFMEQNEELRDDFKLVYQPLDVLDYSYALFYATALGVKLVIVPPKTTAQFWKLVRLGGQIRAALHHPLPWSVTDIAQTITPLIERVKTV